MKFSVVTVSYNHAEFIRQTIESVLAQNYPDFEHLIIDGGSTDGTLDILREYPHLRWISEPDRGQSHALNKGFRMATGDVICWLNSDDWYPSHTFSEVGKVIAEYPVVIGGSELAHRDGTPYEKRGNVNRGWYDILKNWVYHSSPDQPSVFFRRHILDEFKLPNGDFIDESLHFAMDYDWWLRIGAKYPLSRYIPRTLSYIRVYDTAKTGAHMSSVYREMSRVFRRHEAARVAIEQNISFIIPSSGPIADFDQPLARINNSALPRIEVLIADASPDTSTQRQNRRKLLDLESLFPRLLLRHVGCAPGTRSAWEATHNALLEAKSPVAVVMDRTATIVTESALNILRIFEQDNVALVLSTKLVDGCAGNGVITAPVALKIPAISDGFAIRTLAYREVSENYSTPMSHLPLRSLSARLIHRAWLALSSSILDVCFVQHSAREYEQAFGLYTNAALLNEFRVDTSTDSFAALRAKNGFALLVPEELWQLARQHLDQAPADWTSLHEWTSEEQLREIVLQRPHFGPARLLLAEALGKRGSRDEAATERNAYVQVSEHEMKSPLYS